jgi:betaine-aldehyde dehydrogenase
MSEKIVLENIINGETGPAADGRSMDIIDPSTGAVYATSPLSGAADVDRAYGAATEAFKSWRWSTPSERQAALLKFADHVEAHADELVAVEVQDTGKPTALTLSEEIGPMVDQIRFFAGAARVLDGRSQGEYMRGHTSSIRREPVGVVGQVAPWNYPMMMAVWKFAPALAAGCSVVLKPSDTTPASSVWMGKALQEFYPPGVVNVICGDRDTGAALTSHRAPALVSITGSTGAGIAVATAAAKNVTRAHLELGGKAPVVVFDDASIEAAVEGVSLAGQRPARPRPGPLTTPMCCTGRSTTPTSSRTSPAWWTGRPSTRTSPPAGTDWTGPATTTSRPSLRVCTRPTRSCRPRSSVR